ncbi:MAG TPA: hypothetical protein VEK76_03345 [Candidatus Binatia bacterium]|nr:hypothetical protein [Candidatus Binatia bacterium]
MARFPGRPSLSLPLRRRPSRLRRWLIPVLGAVTPVGLIVVNIAVFIERHLAAFRWTIAILAFVSGMMLNSWIGLKIYRLFQRRFSEHALASEINQDMVLIGGMSVIIAASFVTALFCYIGLSNEANLPNATTFLTGVFAILLPLVLQFIFQRMLGGTRKDGQAGESRGELPATPPPPPPPPSARGAQDLSLERRR